MSRVDEQLASLAIALLPGIGCARFHALIERHGSAAGVLHAPPQDHPSQMVHADRMLARAELLLERMAAQGIRLIPQTSPYFPACLLEKRRIREGAIPPFLCVRGDLHDALARPRVAIIGASRASNAGQRIAQALATSLAQRGVVVISGHAHGIDTAAHAGALCGGGVTVAVLPTGILSHTRKPQRGPFDAQALERMVLVSEFVPTEEWNAGYALQRNGTVALFSQVIIAVETERTGGTIDTCMKARGLDLPLTTLAWPGDHPLRGGPDMLLADHEARALNKIWPPDIEACADAVLAILQHA